MIPIGISLVGFLLVFTRISTCMMILPGFSAIQVPMMVRLFIALGLSISIYFLLQISINLSAPIRPDQLFTPAGRGIFDCRRTRRAGAFSVSCLVVSGRNHYPDYRVKPNSRNTDCRQSDVNRIVRSVQRYSNIAVFFHRPAFQFYPCPGDVI